MSIQIKLDSTNGDRKLNRTRKQYAYWKAHNGEQHSGCGKNKDRCRPALCRDFQKRLFS